MINLPSVYTQEIWERTKNPFNKQYIGKQYVSWSQVESFNDKSGFNTGLLGEYEYLLKYFCKKTFPDLGWGQFGQETECYITLRDVDPKTLDEKTCQDLLNSFENFTPEEKGTLEDIKPLGVFQDEICFYVKELDIIVLGYIDDRSPEKDGVVEMLRDFKTKSEASKKDLHDDKKHQIELYILGLGQRGLIVKNAEYCIIERLGGKECMSGGGRESLSIGKRVWTEPYKWDENRLKVTEQMIIDTVGKISELYTIYQKYFKNE